MSKKSVETTSYSETDSTSGEEIAAADFGIYAMIRNADSIVQDKLTCLATFIMNGYFFIPITEKTTCEEGMKYDATNGTFNVVETSST